VQELWSSQLRAVPEQVPAWHLSWVVQALLSLHVVPGDLFVQDVVLTLGWQLWQGFCGFVAPEP
jgi:hypothetical protein